MKERTRKLWAEQDGRHPGDREHLFGAVAEAFEAPSVLYPGSFVDIAPSFWFDDVTYADIDRRAAQFFEDRAGVDEIIATNRRAEGDATWSFHHQSYEDPLPLEDESVDLLISLYAGFISERCSRYLRPGGLLLANPSHGDVAMAALDPRYTLAGAIHRRNGTYRIDDRELDRYLIPRRDDPVTRDSLHASNRGVAYTTSAFAYLFRRR